MLTMLFSGIKLMMIISMMFCANSHPLSLIMLLILATLLSAFMISSTLKSSWLSLVFIIIMLGGLLVLFIYIASLAANEPFTMSKILYLTPLVAMFSWFPQQSMKLNFIEPNLSTLFNTNSAMNSLGAVLYLLIALLVVVEIISCYKAPLRSN